MGNQVLGEHQEQMGGSMGMDMEQLRALGYDSSTLQVVSWEGQEARDEAPGGTGGGVECI